MDDSDSFNLTYQNRARAFKFEIKFYFKFHVYFFLLTIYFIGLIFRKKIIAAVSNKKISIFSKIGQ